MRLLSHTSAFSTQTPPSKHTAVAVVVVPGPPRRRQPSSRQTSTQTLTPTWYVLFPSLLLFSLSSVLLSPLSSFLSSVLRSGVLVGISWALCESYRLQAFFLRLLLFSLSPFLLARLSSPPVLIFAHAGGALRELLGSVRRFPRASPPLVTLAFGRLTLTSFCPLALPAGRGILSARTRPSLVKLSALLPAHAARERARQNTTRMRSAIGF